MFEVNIYIKVQKGDEASAGAAVVEFIKDGKEITREVSSISREPFNAVVINTVNQALKILIKKCNVTVHIDSIYIKSAISNGWMQKWKANEWKKATGKEVDNKIEWQQLLMATELHNIRWEKYQDKYEDKLNKIIERSFEVL